MGMLMRHRKAAETNWEEPKMINPAPVVEEGKDVPVDKLKSPAAKSVATKAKK